MTTTKTTSTMLCGSAEQTVGRLQVATPVCGCDVPMILGDACARMKFPDDDVDRRSSGTAYDFYDVSSLVVRDARVARVWSHVATGCASVCAIRTDLVDPCARCCLCALQWSVCSPCDQDVFRAQCSVRARVCVVKESHARLSPCFESASHQA